MSSGSRDEPASVARADTDEDQPRRAVPVTPDAPLAVVRPEWVDSYGHMNMAFYLAVFDMATDALWPRLGLGAPFNAKGLGTFAAETWVSGTTMRFSL